MPRPKAGGCCRIDGHAAHDAAIALPADLADIGVEKNTTIVFPLPLEMMTLLNKASAALKPASDQP